MLERLQTELVEYVLSYLKRIDILTLCHVSRQLYLRVVPSLYSHIILKITKSVQSKLKIPLLLRTISENPLHAAQVRAFSVLGGAPTETLHHRKDEHSWRRKTWELPASRAIDRALLVCIIQSLPNIQEITIGFKFLLGLWAPDLSCFAIDQRCPILSPKSLKAVTIAPDLHDEGQKLYQYAWDESRYELRSPDSIFSEAPLVPLLFTRLFELPRLAYLDILVPSTLSSDHLAKVPCLWTLTSLSLRSTICNEQVLATILSRTPGLTRLQYHRFFDSQRLPYSLPNPPALREALGQVCDTLKIFIHEIEVYEYANLGFEQSGEEYVYPGPATRLGSLQGMKALQTLEIPIEVLCGSSKDVLLSKVLPPRLATLTLRNDLVYFMDGYPWRKAELLYLLSTWLEPASAQICSVENIELAIHHHDQHWSTTDLGEAMFELNSLLRSNGIKIYTRSLSRRSYGRGIDWKCKHIPYDF